MKDNDIIDSENYEKIKSRKLIVDALQELHDEEVKQRRTIFFGKIKYKILSITSSLFIIVSILSVFILTFIVKSSGNGKTEDLLGFVIPHPPTFLGMIPWLGYVLERIYELLSVHGLVVISMFFVFMSIGLSIKNYSKKLIEK